MGAGAFLVDDFLAVFLTLAVVAFADFFFGEAFALTVFFAVAFLAGLAGAAFFVVLAAFFFTDFFFAAFLVVFDFFSVPADFPNAAAQPSAYLSVDPTRRIDMVTL